VRKVNPHRLTTDLPKKVFLITPVKIGGRVIVKKDPQTEEMKEILFTWNEGDPQKLHRRRAR